MNKFSSPKLEIRISRENYETAIRSNSGGCLIADAIKRQYPQFTGIVVDMATIRISDRSKGRRYTYLTPAKGQHTLLSFDQGWAEKEDEIVIPVARAVKITPIKTVEKRYPTAEARAARICELEAKESEGSITPGEKQSLSRYRNAEKYKKTEVKVHSDKTVTVAGGPPIPQGESHPNLLRGRDRHFGSKLADPGEAFRNAVEIAVAERIEKEGK